MLRRVTLAALLMAAPWMVGCDDSTSSDTSEEATFTFSPDPAIAVQSTDGKTYTIVGDDTHPDQIIKYPWKTTFTVTMEETAGVGRDITAMNISVKQATSGVVITPAGSESEHYDYLSHATSNRLEAKGKTSVTFDVWYDLPNDGKEGLIAVTFSYTDDNDSSFSESAQVQVH
jgi:hypothetical protein